MLLLRRDRHSVGIGPEGPQHGYQSHGILLLNVVADVLDNRAAPALKQAGEVRRLFCAKTPTACAADHQKWRVDERRKGS